MLITASTVKDSPANVRRFVARNLASGIDHLIVFLDAPREDGQPEVMAELAAHPHVTPVAAGRGWWQGARPANLNDRQNINANAAHRWVRTVFPDAWIAHIDGDEVARIDRAALAALTADVEAIRLVPLESAAQWEEATGPARFKRLLTDPELNLLHVLGVLSEPTNQAYFHGHVMGKTALRATSRLAFTIHHPVDSRGAKVAPWEQPESFSVLHYESVSGEEFIRKWTALAKAGKARYRADRQPTARALSTLVSLPLEAAARERQLRRIFERTTQDDVATLADLGLLVDVEPEAGGHTPRELTSPQREQLAAQIAATTAADKSGLLPPAGRPPAGADSAGRGWRDRLGR